MPYLHRIRRARCIQGKCSASCIKTVVQKINSIGKSVFFLTALAGLSFAEVIPDQLLPAELGPPLDSGLTKTDYFLALPHCVLPLTPSQRSEAVKSPWFRDTGGDFEGKISYKNHMQMMQLWRSIEVSVVAFTSEYRPILLVRKTSKFAGMIERLYTEQFMLKREKDGWIICDQDGSKK